MIFRKMKFQNRKNNITIQVINISNTALFSSQIILRVEKKEERK